MPDGARAASLAACSPIPAGFADAPTLLACCLDPGGGPEAGTELAAGAALRTLLLSLHALGVEASFQPADRRELGATLGLEPGWEPLGLLSAGHPG
jgi:hypothetical protein